MSESATMVLMRRIGRALTRPAVYSPLLAALISSVLAIIALHMVGMRWDIPLQYNGDAIAVASHFKTVIETGWYEYQPALGAPYGQVYFDYPTADNLHFMVAFLLGLIWPNWAIVMNLHFLLGFPLAAVAAVWLFRRLGMSPAMAISLSVLYSIAPYHFIRGEGHLFLSWYWVVPLALSIVIDVLRGAPLWGARPGMRRGFGHVLGRSGATVGILALVATCSAYYAVFTLILGGVAAIAAVWVSRNWRRFAGAAVAAGVTIVVLVLNMAPDLLYRLENGANPGALQRTPVESEIYALKLTQLLLPAPYHRFGPFNHLRTLYDEHFPIASEQPALGLVGALGFVVVVIAGFYIIARAVARVTPRKTGLADGPSPLTTALAPLAFLTGVAFLFSTVGGLSTLVSFATTALRSWNRMSIVIAALALAGLGLVIDAVARSLSRRASKRPVRWAIAIVPAVLVLGIGVWDQIPPYVAQARASVVESFESDATFAADLDAELDDDAMVFELPYMDFPESPQFGDALDSDQLRLFLHSDDIRVSGGGIRGREDVDSLGALASLPPAQFVEQASALGFEGVVIDNLAYSSDVKERAIRAVTSGPEIRSDDGRYVYLGF